MGIAYFNAFSDDGYLVGELNEIPWQKMGDKGHHGPGNHGKRLAGLDDGPIIFCAVPVLACTWLPIFFFFFFFGCISTSFRATDNEVRGSATCLGLGHNRGRSECDIDTTGWGSIIGKYF